MGAPPPPLPSDKPGQRIVGSFTKMGAAIAAFAGGVTGLVSFFNLGALVVIPSLYIGMLLVCGYVGLTAKHRWVRVVNWVLFSLLMIIGLVILYALNWLSH
jgi:hypothetical protein